MQTVTAASISDLSLSDLAAAVRHLPAPRLAEVGAMVHAAKVALVAGTHWRETASTARDPAAAANAARLAARGLSGAAEEIFVHGFTLAATQAIA